ncbi:hypothetical protein FIA58_001605 [Flavobacterium jejuense]|uniref:Uncharacterized protein n=1 Tax=Flavobacterium jejuense TaxID=1544455 RepID=A0ABX0IN24_9FLAO|nr:hypothetical protein [Flavobacterium jejuense]NHN24357.1 hypothetical protein [Flavobacterium jejuense]
MKKITQVLVIVVLAFSLQTAKASDKKVFDDVSNRNYPPVDYRYADPIVFMERGIEFYVFPNGEFDFNTVTTTAPNRRNSNVNRTYGAPSGRGNSRSYYGPSNGGTKIEHDYMGRVRRVGNVFINYDATGRVKRVGSVYMNYNSFALTQVGGLRIIYDRRGRIVNIIGTVNSYNGNYTYTTNNNHYQADNQYNYNSGYDNNDSDEDYYYYRQDGTKAKMLNEDIKELDKKN